MNVGRRYSGVSGKPVSRDQPPQFCSVGGSWHALCLSLIAFSLPGRHGCRVLHCKRQAQPSSQEATCGPQQPAAHKREPKQQRQPRQLHRFDWCQEHARRAGRPARAEQVKRPPVCHEAQAQRLRHASRRNSCMHMGLHAAWLAPCAHNSSQHLSNALAATPH